MSDALVLISLVMTVQLSGYNDVQLPSQLNLDGQLQLEGYVIFYTNLITIVMASYMLLATYCHVIKSTSMEITVIMIQLAVYMYVQLYVCAWIVLLSGQLANVLTSQLRLWLAICIFFYLYSHVINICIHIYSYTCMYICVHQ